MINIIDQKCAHLCSAIYHPTLEPTLWAKYDGGLDDGVCWGLVRDQDFDYVVFRGSDSFPDWMKDLTALANPFTHHFMGPVHPGFLLGLTHVWEEVKPLLQKPTILTGHSLGAGRAGPFCGLMIRDGVPPARRVCFGEPKPGFKMLADFIAPVPAASYRNGDEHHHDLVTDVPFSFPPEEYVHPIALTHVSAPPVDMAWGIFAYHHMPLYEQALTQI